MPRLLWLLPLLMLVAGCPQTPDRPVPPPNPPPDTDWCRTMCEHIGPKGLKCEEGEDVYNNDLPGPTGVPNQSCADNCVELQNKGFFVNPRCVTDVPSCDKIEEYRQHDAATCGKK
jgi:hypothetical protein